MPPQQRRRRAGRDPDGLRGARGAGRVAPVGCLRQSAPASRVPGLMGTRPSRETCISELHPLAQVPAWPMPSRETLRPCKPAPCDPEAGAAPQRPVRRSEHGPF